MPEPAASSPNARTVRLEPSGHTFTVEPGETVLEAALRHGVGLPYGCRNGACGSCKGTLKSGEIEYGPHQERAIRAALDGAHVITATPTASGKSLCLHLPVLDALAKDESANAIYLYPTKALSRDQEHGLHALIREAELGIGACRPCS